MVRLALRVFGSMPSAARLRRLNITNARAQRAGFTLYTASAHAAENVAAARAAAEAAVASAEEREASDLLVAQALVAADHAVAAHRAAVILAANTARDYTAAAAEARIQGTRYVTVAHILRAGSTRRSQASSARASGPLCRGGS